VIERAVLVPCFALACALPLNAACGDAPSPAAAAHATPAAQATPPAPPPVVLRARLEFPTGEARPTGLAAIDLDGDRRDELVAVVRGPGAVQIWSGLSNRPTVTPAPKSYEIGDFALGPEPFGAWKPGRDGGPAIIAVAPRNESALMLVDVRALHLGSGDPLVLRMELAARPRVLACGDLGADGTFEVAIVTLDDELLIVRDGAIVGRQPLSDAQTTCVRFTADGRALLVGSQVTRRVVRLEPVADGRLVEKSAATLAGLPRSIDEIEGWRGAVGSRFVVAAGDDQLVWLDADMKIERTEVVGTVPIDVLHGGTRPARVRLAISVHGQQATFEREDGTPPGSTYAGQHPVAGALGDFDGDGRLDAAIANSDAKRISLLFAAPQGGFQVCELSRSGRQPHSIDTGDLDGDGRLDVVALCALDSSVQVHRGTPAGLVEGVSQGRIEGADRLRLRDLDGDGKLDALFLRPKVGGIVLDAWFGDGTGRLWARAETRGPICAQSMGDLLVADVDGDGVEDALVSDPAAGRVTCVPLLRGDGASLEFGTMRAFDVDGAPRDLALVRRDGPNTFVAVALTGAPPRAGWALLQLQRGEGRALQLTEIHHEPSAEPARGLAVAMPGTQIVLVSGSDGLGLLRIDSPPTLPGGAWTVSEPFPTGLRAIVARSGDLDGDGRADHVVSAQNSHHLNLWLSSPGNGERVVRMPDLGVGTGPLDVRLVDLDGDGALEILAACGSSNELAVIRMR